MSSIGSQELIAVDWGSSRLRVWRLDRAGRVIDARTSDDGAAGLGPEEFEPRLRQVLDGWWAPGAPVLCCGVVGSRQGWVEAPYCAAPAGLADLAQAVVAAPGELGAILVPGVSQRSDGVLADVMRGEETQALGLGIDGIIVCPGTHSKWIEVQEGQIRRFQTFFTGELHGLLATHSILRHSLAGPAEPSAVFAEGVRRSLDGEPLISSLFSIRIASLDDRQTGGQGSAQLSGLVIGAEIAAAGPGFERERLTVIGAPALSDLYLAALRIAGAQDVSLVDAQAATTCGLWSIWRQIR